MKTFSVKEKMTGSEVAREMHRCRMQNYRMWAAIVLLFGCIVIGLALKFADAIDRLPEEENCEVHYPEIPQYDAVWRGIVVESTTESRCNWKFIDWKNLGYNRLERVNGPMECPICYLINQPTNK